ncbi:MAG: DNA polymerase I [Gammaproteobacteria bacterium]|nr:DNA polymerase I [Gammaproteobacteria bacterium]
MTLSQKPVVLIDGSSYLYRAFHALPPLANTKGEPTGAIYGVISMIKKLINDYEPDYMAVIFDPKGKTQRDAIYSEYKAHRPPMPTDLSMQVGHIFEIIKAMGLPIIIEDGIEADDVIGTLANQATELGMSTLISTGDKDMAQLVSPTVTLINTMNGIIFDREGVIKKFGIPPEQIVDYLSLIGDKVDNVPGIPNVGPKTAVKWLAEYGSLEGVIAHAGEIKGKVGENLREHLPILSLSKKLVTIFTDINLAEKIPDLTKQEPDKALLLALYKHLEFKTWLSELLSEQVSHAHEKYHVILNETDLAKWVERLSLCNIYSFDIETTHYDAMLAELVGIAFAIAPKESIYIPLAHDYEDAPAQLNTQRVLAALLPILQDQNKILIGENLKFVLNVLLHYGVEVSNQMYDTMLESYVQNSSLARHDKNSLSLKYLGRQSISYEEVAGKGAKQIICNKLDIEKVTQYAAESADIIFQLHHTMWEKIANDQHMKKILVTLEMPLLRVLARMEYEGVLISAEMLHQHSIELTKRIQSLEEEAYTLAGCKFNLGSPKQLQTVFYEKLQLPILSKTPTGQPSTSEAILQELAHDYPLPRIILEYRTLNKIKTTYTDKLPLQINPKTGRVHTCYNQAVTATGRLSSTDPNLQNIPIRTEEGRRIRQAFIASPHHKIVSADYSQIELRIMAHLAKDPGLLHAFANDQDIHIATAAEVFGLTIDQVTHSQRRSAKAINFGLIYGMSAFGLSRQLGIDRQTAQNYIERYFERYPKIKGYMEMTRVFAHQHGYVETLQKRRLYLPEINATNLQRQKAAERAAINAPLQGTAAEIIKMAMIHIDNWLQTSKLGTKMIMQVHDELVFEVPESEVDEVIAKVTSFMVNTIELDVPLAIDIGIGNNWDEAH